LAKHLEGKVSLVTGASRGIGRAIAERLASDGSHVVLAARTAEACEPVAAAIAEAHDVETLCLAIDVGDADSVTAGIKAAIERFGHVDWDTVLRTDLSGVFLCSRAVLRSMLRRRQGRIVSISSVVGLMGNAGQTNYAAAKAGVHGFTKALAREVASRSITVNAIAPGYVESDMTSELGEETKQRLQEQIPLGRMGSGDDIAGVVSFLLSDDASYITGQVVSVDGGMYM